MPKAKKKTKVGEVVYEDEDGAGGSGQVLDVPDDRTVMTERFPFLSNVSTVGEIEEYMKDLARMYASAQSRESVSLEEEMVSNIIPPTPNVLAMTPELDAQVVIDDSVAVQQPLLFDSPKKVPDNVIADKVAPDPVKPSQILPPVVKKRVYDINRLNARPPPIPPRGRTLSRAPPLPPRCRSVAPPVKRNRMASPYHENAFDYYMGDSSEDEGAGVQQTAPPLPSRPARKRRRVLAATTTAADTPPVDATAGVPTSSVAAGAVGAPVSAVTIDTQAVALVIKDLMGVGPNCKSGDFYNSFMLAGAYVDPKIKSKIIAGDYVELSSLAPKDETPASLSMQFANDDPNQVNFTPSKTCRKPASLAEWNYLFFAYASIYLPHHPEEGAQIVTYMQRIADMQKDEPNTYIWRQFDESFRKMREGCKGDPLPWHIHHPQCISNAKSAYYRSLSQQRSNTNTNSNTNTRGGGYSGRRGGQGGGRGGFQGQNRRRFANLCDKYNEGSCTFQKCKFTHLCSICRGVHPATHCKNGPSPKPQASATNQKNK